MIFNGLEKIGYIVLFHSPDQFYVKLVNGKESIVLNKPLSNKVPTKNEICTKATFIIDYNSDYVLCEVIEDLKYDEVYCQIILCNSNIQLKVNYRRLSYLNDEDIINYDGCSSYKFHDFAPVLPNYWNPYLIIKLKKLLTYNKFIFQFKSIKVDPVDGRYPVEILRIIDKQSIIDEFIDGKSAMRSSENFKAAFDNEILQIFSARKEKTFRYKISAPLVKCKPVLRAGKSQSHPLNIRAVPFMPTVNGFPISSQSLEIKNSPVQWIKSINNSLPYSSINKTFSSHVSLEKSEHLTSNIVHMFSEMYKNSQSKLNSGNKVPFANYQSIFPNYGGVNFNVSNSLKKNSENNKTFNNSYTSSQPKTINSTSQNGIDISSIPLPPDPNFLPISNVSSSGIEFVSNLLQQKIGFSQSNYFSSETNKLLITCPVTYTSSASISTPYSSEMVNPSYVISAPPINYSTDATLKNISSFNSPDIIKSSIQNDNIIPSQCQIVSYCTTSPDSDQIRYANCANPEITEINVDKHLNELPVIENVISSMSDLTFVSSDIIAKSEFDTNYFETTNDIKPVVLSHAFPNGRFGPPFHPCFPPPNYFSKCNNESFRNNIFPFYPNIRHMTFPYPQTNMSTSIPVNTNPHDTIRDQFPPIFASFDNSIPNAFFIPNSNPGGQKGTFHIQPMNIIYYKPN